MEFIYPIILGCLFLFAVIGLVVGVSNDAVNFLNSGIGAKAGSFKFLMIIASLGIMIGAVFSGGMMEVARSGVFHPAQFSFHQVMMLFLAVMITNILLFDFFNSLGLPTSTTVALVFALLGAATAMAVIKINVNGESMAMIGKYLNSGRAFGIISAIFVSIAIAFTVGFVVMYLSRIIFSFNYSRYFHVLGSLFGGISIAFITYFIIIKGLKDVSFIPDSTLTFIMEHTFMLLAAITVCFFLIFELILFFVKFNVFKIIVFYGTFALALSFAGNDLVNFIGVPIAGYHSWLEFCNSQIADPNSLMMESLTKPVQTEVVFLVLAGGIMAVTLWFSKKAKNVVATTVNLSTQKDGDEQFDSTQFARIIVRFFHNLSGAFSKDQESRFRKFVDTRFTPLPVNESEINPPAFDMVRAAMNLMVASSLIAFGTSLKLPLSTTYVTFMVAMGTSLSDRAWGRESAVYRVSGVFTVIGGWFITALIAFVVSAFFAVVFWFGSIYAVILCVPFVFFVLYRTHVMHKKKETENKKKKELEESIIGTDLDIEAITHQSIQVILSEIPEIFEMVYEGLENEDLKTLKAADRLVKALDKKATAYRNAVGLTVASLEEAQLAWGEFYLKVNENLRGIVVAMAFITKPSYQHLDNLHKTLNKNQQLDFEFLKNEIIAISSLVLEYIAPDKPYNGELIMNECERMKNEINVFRLKQIKRIKKKETPSRSSLLFLNIISEIKVINQLLNELYQIEKQRLIAKPAATDVIQDANFQSESPE